MPESAYMNNFAHEEFLKGSSTLCSYKNYAYCAPRISFYDTEHHHETAPTGQAPSPWHLPCFNYDNLRYLPDTVANLTGVSPEAFDNSLIGSPTRSDKMDATHFYCATQDFNSSSPAFPYDPTEVHCESDAAAQDVWNLLVDETAYQASTPDLDVPSPVSTPSSSGECPATPPSTGSPTTPWDAAYHTPPDSPPIADSLIDYSCSPDFQQAFVAQPLFDRGYEVQAPLVVSAYSSLSQALCAASPNCDSDGERPSKAGERRTRARDTHRRARGPYAAPCQRFSTSVISAAAESEAIVLPMASVERSTAAPSENCRLPITISPILPATQHSPLVDRRSVPAVFPSSSSLSATRRRALGPYTEPYQRFSTSLTSTTAEFGAIAPRTPPVEPSTAAPSENTQLPIISSIPLHPSPIDRHSVPAALLPSPRVLAITCTYDGCTLSTATFTGRTAWRTHLTTHHTIPGNATDGGVCRALGCGVYQAESIMRHVLTRHSGVALGCRQCGARFSRVDSLMRHVRRAKGHWYFGGRKDVVYFDEV